MEKLPVIEVSEDNFVSVLPAIRDAISKASFVAIDCVSISLLWTTGNYFFLLLFCFYKVLERGYITLAASQVMDIK